jgi:hypothetical protein
MMSCSCQSAAGTSRALDHEPAQRTQYVCVCVYVYLATTYSPTDVVLGYGGRRGQKSNACNRPTAYKRRRAQRGRCGEQAGGTHALGPTGFGFHWPLAGGCAFSVWGQGTMEPKACGAGEGLRCTCGWSARARGVFFFCHAVRFGGSTQGPNRAVFSPPWPWWAPGGTSHQVVWSGEARGSRGGAPGGTALAIAPGRAAGVVFSPRGGTRRDKWLDRTGRPGLPVLGPQKLRRVPLCVWRYRHGK